MGIESTDKVHVVLVSVGVFQEYILLNINHLLQLGHKRITVITHSKYFNRLGRFSYNSYVKLVDADTFECSQTKQTQQNPVIELDNEFRDGFWVHTSMRFFYLYEYIKKENIQHVVHMENDVLIYHNANILYTLIEQQTQHQKSIPIYLPFDCYERSIASVVYIPTHEILGNVLKNYDGKKNDMENFAQIRKNHPEWIENFPIFPLSLYPSVKEGYIETDEIKFTCRNYEQFGGFIFDAAAMGQYLGGIDKRNNPDYTVGFVNETCVIKYKDMEFVWRNIENVYRPYIRIHELEYPIFNLHFHSKELHYFILYS